MKILNPAKRRLGILFSLIAAVCSTPASAQILGSAPLNIERRAHTATRLADGRVLIIGGENATGPLRQAEIFDPNSQTFSIVANSAARTDHAATLSADGRVLVTGGRDSFSPLDSTEIFDPVTNSFSSGPAMQRARAGHRATVFSDGRILLVGGDAEGSAELYDPTTKSFSLLGAHLSVARSLHGAVLLQDGRVLIAGGVAPGSNTALNSAEIFDPYSLTFAPTSVPMQTARGLPTLRVLPDGKVQIIGGDAEWSMEMFNPETGSFNALAHLPPTSDLLAATLSARSRAALLATTIAQNPMVQSALTDPLVNELLERADHSLTEMPQSNQALVAGGVNSSGEFLHSSMLVGSSSASVTTDRFDYPPGRIVTITGTGWQPGETVSLVLHEEPETHPDVLVSSVADQRGNFINTDFAPDPSDVGRTFTLTAIGLTSGETAQTAFADAPSVSAITISIITGNGTPCSGATPCSNPIHIAGTASVQNFQGQLSSYHVQIDWGDGTVIPGNEAGQNPTNFTTSGDNFSGSWSSNPDHTYTSGGSKTIKARLYHTQPPGNDSTADSVATATLIVTVTPTVTTAIHNGSDHITSVTSVPAGSTVHDNATVTGNSPTGTVIVSFWNNGTCSGGAAATSSPQSLSGGSVDATGFAQGPLAGGNYSFKAHYNGDSGNTAADSDCEPLVVTKIDSTSVTTIIHDASHSTVTTVTAGTTVHDSVTVAGSVGTPTGTATFKWFTNGTCAGTPAATSSAFNLSGGTVDGTTFTQTPSTSGSFAFMASYNGDGTYNVSDSSCEPLTATRRSTSTSIDLNPGTVIAGQSSTAIVTVTDTDSNGTKSNPGVGTTVAIVSSVGSDTIGAPCTLAAVPATTDKSRCQVEITPAAASIHTITVTFAQTAVHQGSDNSPGASLAVTTRHTTTTVAFNPTSVDVGQATTATITVTDDDANGTKSFPTGTVSVASDSGDTITGACTLASTATAGVSKCQVTVTPTHASTHTITATFAATTIHTASSGNNGLNVTTRHTTTTVAFVDNPVVVNQTTTVNVTVTDDDGNGPKSFPIGTVGVISSVGSDGITGTCSLVASAVSGVSTCAVVVKAVSASIHTITATFAATAIHSGSSGNNGLTVNKRATFTAVSLDPPIVIESQTSTVTATVTDNDVGTSVTPTGTVSFSSSVATDIFIPAASCTLVSGSCAVTVKSGSASARVITAVYNGDTIHNISTGTNGLVADPHTLTIDNLSFTPKGGSPLPAGYKSPGIQLNHTLADILGDQSRDHIITTAQNIASGCNLRPSTPASKQFNQPVRGLTAVAFKVWEIGKNNLAIAKRKRCKSVELRITSLSIQAFDAAGLASNTLSATISFCFSTATGQPTACPGATRVAEGASTTGTTAQTSARPGEVAYGALRLDPPLGR